MDLIEIYHKIEQSRDVQRFTSLLNHLKFRRKWPSVKTTDGTRASVFSYPLTTSNTDAGHSKTLRRTLTLMLCDHCHFSRNHEAEMMSRMMSFHKAERGIAAMRCLRSALVCVCYFFEGYLP
jgi:hypothetical protein